MCPITTSYLKTPAWLRHEPTLDPALLYAQDPVPGTLSQSPSAWLPSRITMQAHLEVDDRQDNNANPPVSETLIDALSSEMHAEQSTGNRKKQKALKRTVEEERLILKSQPRP